jgi:putative ABC transport system permease protein
MIEDRTDAYEEFAASMNMMREIANGLVIGAMCATIVILSLLILLFVIDRKEEVGIYLAMGEKRRKVFVQLLVEMLMPCVLAVTLALFVGNIVGGEISHTMLEQDLIAQIEDPDRTFSRGQLYHLGFQIEMTPEEMMSAYEVRLSFTTVVSFYAIALTVIIAAVATPVFYITGLNPKKILM